MQILSIFSRIIKFCLAMILFCCYLDEIQLYYFFFSSYPRYTFGTRLVSLKFSILIFFLHLPMIKQKQQTYSSMVECLIVRTFLNWTWVSWHWSDLFLAFLTGVLWHDIKIKTLFRDLLLVADSLMKVYLLIVSLNYISWIVEPLKKHTQNYFKS